MRVQGIYMEGDFNIFIIQKKLISFIFLNNLSNFVNYFCFDFACFFRNLINYYRILPISHNSNLVKRLVS